MTMRSYKTEKTKENKEKIKSEKEIVCQLSAAVLKAICQNPLFNIKKDDLDES